jgi:hypothetical protein
MLKFLEEIIIDKKVKSWGSCLYSQPDLYFYNVYYAKLAMDSIDFNRIAHILAKISTVKMFMGLPA